MPFGGDVQDLRRTRNLLFRHAMAVDYPHHRNQQDVIRAKVGSWTRHASHVISGCDWVEYMYYWDTLMLAHFSIDTERWRPAPTRLGEAERGRPLRVLHAPNHRAIKGTRYFVEAVRQLREEGVAIELTILERVPNSEIRKAIAEADVIADQLIVGWYAMFALEALAMGKPVICYLREDLLDLYESAGLVEKGEIPIISCRPSEVKDTLRRLATADRDALGERGARGIAFVNKHHSTEAVGRVFDRINRSLGINPASAGAAPDSPPGRSMESRQ
jgi:glycosyltransferase involved in cell wall biosynthesis